MSCTHRDVFKLEETRTTVVQDPSCFWMEEITKYAIEENIILNQLEIGREVIN